MKIHLRAFHLAPQLTSIVLGGLVENALVGGRSTPELRQHPPTKILRVSSRSVFDAASKSTIQIGLFPKTN